ncbi:SOS response-associated peptidase [Microvirga tunisiensis]|uniref:Abasic site processing protein n=1 Tax=Pannonibacter tanglangensis TaxID=2750084 RepID=A0A7X5JA04_9HYPH|nr:SOS response-associated peptidase [Pannonibacter sp. XCT-53]NBN78885.1 SOS response-associated peptidase [Pannonibacter sp. XCT-53]
MCGRMTLTATPDEVKLAFGYADTPNFPPRYNIAPTQPLAIVRQVQGRRRFGLVRWGLIPAWVKDPAAFTLLVNARAETAAEKPSFRGPMRHHRCLVPASGFYEWRRHDGSRQAFFIRPKQGGLVAFAGLFETWSDPAGGEIDTGLILTVPANRTVSAVHDRMPAVLAPELFDAWLDTAHVDSRAASRLLQPAPEDQFELIPVSARVNTFANDDAAVQEPVEDRGAPPPAAPRKTASRPDDGQFDLFG